jgi:inner membrane protein
VDNVTHSLAGLLLAESVVQIQVVRGRPPSDRERSAIYFTSILANNLPDFDFLYARITHGQLGYLLHHRGMTHTLVAAVPLALLALVPILAWPRWRRQLSWSIAAVALLGPLLHVLMDYGNNYGVHPLWPFDNRWVYGDSIFIVEPLWWAAAIPPLIPALRSRVARGVLAAVLLVGLVLVWRSGLVPPLAQAWVALLAVAMAVLAWRLAAPGRLLAAVVAVLGVAAVFVGAGHIARRRLSATLGRDFPADTLRDLVTTPMPADPLCWQGIAVQTQGGTYAVTTTTLSLAPGVIAPAQCQSRTGTTTAPTRSVQAKGERGLVYHGRFSAPLSRLVALARDNCQARAFLRWARVPFWVGRGSELVIGDLRYDRSPGLGFAELLVPRHPVSCPRFVPPWVPPRAALLR